MFTMFSASPIASPTSEVPMKGLLALAAVSLMLMTAQAATAPPNDKTLDAVSMNVSLGTIELQAPIDLSSVELPDLPMIVDDYLSIDDVFTDVAALQNHADESEFIIKCEDISLFTGEDWRYILYNEQRPQVRVGSSGSW